MPFLCLVLQLAVRNDSYSDIIVYILEFCTMKLVYFYENIEVVGHNFNLREVWQLLRHNLSFAGGKVSNMKPCSSVDGCVKLLLL